jgi:dTMP kinase
MDIFVLEGLDGSGKATQSLEIAKRLNLTRLDFPQYKSPTGGIINAYLTGEFGAVAGDISPYFASSLFAADRYAYFNSPTFPKGEKFICDRYISSNAIYQGAKIEDKKEREDFFAWLYDYEVNRLKIPAPTKTIFLNVPIEISMEMIRKRENNNDLKHQGSDIHEDNVEYLKKCRENALALSEKYNWSVIDTTEGGIYLSKEEITKKILKEIL